MGNASSKPIQHAIQYGERINTIKLLREWRAYLQWQGGSGDELLKRATAQKFVRDFCEMYFVDKDTTASLMLVVELDTRSLYSYDDFKRLLLTIREASPSNFDLSHSLNQSTGDAANTDYIAIPPTMLDIPPCTSFVPLDPTGYTPPAQLMGNGHNWLLFVFLIVSLTHLS
jgi:hypothetical protein